MHSTTGPVVTSNCILAETGRVSGELWLVYAASAMHSRTRAEHDQTKGFLVVVLLMQVAVTCTVRRRRNYST